MPLLPPPPSGQASLGPWRSRLPWLLLTLGMVTLVTLLVLTRPFPRFDRLLQEPPLWLAPQTASPDIVLIAIDDKSLEAIGRWPWRRALHAELLRRITTGNPKCIGLDLLLTEADHLHPDDDALLARRMRENGCVVLPMALHARQTGSPYQIEILPIPELAQAAAAIGRAHLALDDDGVARSFHRRGGFPGRPWPHFAEALLLAEQQRTTPNAPRLVQPDVSHAVSSPPAGPWHSEDREVLRYISAGSHFTTYSYIDVLRGDVPGSAFSNRFVLIGPTSAGLADVYATSGPDTHALMSGVEIFANIVQNLESGDHVAPATTAQDLVFNLVPLLIALAGLLWLRPFGIAALVLLLLALRVAVQAAQPWTGVQFAPAAGFIGLLLVHPTWSVLRLMAALRFLRKDTTELLSQIGGEPSPDHLPTPAAGDFLDRQMATTSAMLRRVRDLHRFVRDGIDHLPDATLILNRAGNVFLANAAAGQHWGVPSAELIGRNASMLLDDIHARSNDKPMITADLFTAAPATPVIGEGQDSHGRTVLLRCIPFFDAGNAYAGWMVALVDITAMRRAQSQRDEALRFISHDIREPSASILTVLELARAQPGTLPRDMLLQRIERHARTGLQLADGFVNLARAEAQPFKPELLDLVELLAQTIDNAWVEARTHRVRILLVNAPEEALCIADRNLLPRALTNVLGNALKYSPPDAEVRCAITERPHEWAISVQDQGPGIPAELQPQLFKPFHRLHRESHPEVPGVGLGLLLVRTAMHRHGGSVEIDSAENAGCTVTLVLPKPAPSTLENLARADALNED